MVGIYSEYRYQHYSTANAQSEGVNELEECLREARLPHTTYINLTYSDLDRFTRNPEVQDEFTPYPWQRDGISHPIFANDRIVLVRFEGTEWEKFRASMAIHHLNYKAIDFPESALEKIRGPAYTVY
ncbi:MAG: hypothetical protein ACQESG_03555 [Nanobdellota archaeon]